MPGNAFACRAGGRDLECGLGVQDRRRIDDIQDSAGALASHDAVNQCNRRLTIGHSVMMSEPAHVADLDVVQIAESEPAGEMRQRPVVNEKLHLGFAYGQDCDATEYKRSAAISTRYGHLSHLIYSLWICEKRANAPFNASMEYSRKCSMVN